MLRLQIFLNDPEKDREEWPQRGISDVDISTYIVTRQDAHEALDAALTAFGGLE